MTRAVTDRYLPPDREAFVAAEPSTGRIIVIAPTRAVCETIELALGLHIPTVLEKQHGGEIWQLADAGIEDPTTYNSNSLATIIRLAQDGMVPDGSLSFISAA